RADLAKEGKSLAVIARTVKGWGVPNLRGMGHHGTPVAKDELDSVLAALDERARELVVAEISHEEMARALTITPPASVPASPVPARSPAGFMAAVNGDAKVAKSVEAKKALSPRRAYGLALKALGAA